VAFVCLLAAAAGSLVAGFHLLIKYSGCPLGVNGCDKAHGLEDKAFKLLKLIDS
ncbi:unnamed protein product, partial [Polarella glacialis]